MALESASKTAVSDLVDADLCVKCGLCLPHCPTYQLHRLESESPRGRLELIQGWARDELALSDSLLQHTDRCLLCGACERACPSAVPYGRLMDRFRAEQVARRGHRLLSLLLDSLLLRPRWLERAVALLRFYRSSGVARLLRHLPGPFWRQAAALTPPSARSARSHRKELTTSPSTSSSSRSRPRVGLFLGCVARAFDLETLASTRRLLEALGYQVVIPADQACCGALHLHHGRPHGTGELASRNMRAFSGCDRVVASASGCLLSLKQYAELFPEKPAVASFSNRCYDIGELILNGTEHAMTQLPPLRALPARVALHTPCTARNGLRQAPLGARLLEQIPDLTITPLTDSALCCGAAGLHMLTHPEQANALRQPKINALASLDVDYLASTNIGCALHLAAGVREQGLAIEVVHPVTLLARQLISSEEPGERNLPDR